MKNIIIPKIVKYIDFPYKVECYQSKTNIRYFVKFWLIILAVIIFLAFGYNSMAFEMNGYNEILKMRNITPFTTIIPNINIEKLPKILDLIKKVPDFKSPLLNTTNNKSDPYPNWKKLISKKRIEVKNHELILYDLPNKYYKNIDCSTFQPYMSYKAITNKKSTAYQIVNHTNAYTDENGFRRFKLNDKHFKIDNKDDYVIALGKYYNEKGHAGVRYLIVTATGMYTAITGDVKANEHTDERNMFSQHGNKAGMIEWILDLKHRNLDRNILNSGTVVNSNIKELQGKILYIYKILSK